jgi:hypothetical protein
VLAGPGRCASRTCACKTRAWNELFDRRKRIRLQGAEFCFPQCFEREMRRVLEGPLAPQFRSSSSRRIPLGLLMLSQGKLTPEQLQSAVSAQKNAGSGFIGEWLRALGFAEEPDIAAALALQWSCPVMRRLPRQLPGKMLPLHLLRSKQIVPVYFSSPNRILHVAFAGEVDYTVLVSIEHMLECKTAPCLITPRELDSALDWLTESEAAREKIFENCRDAEEIAHITSSYAGHLSATEVRCSNCGEISWTRCLHTNGPTDLLFKISPAPIGTVSSFHNSSRQCSCDHPQPPN